MTKKYVRLRIIRVKTIFWLPNSGSVCSRSWYVPWDPESGCILTGEFLENTANKFRSRITRWHTWGDKQKTVVFVNPNGCQMDGKTVANYRMLELEQQCLPRAPAACGITCPWITGEPRTLHNWTMGKHCGVGEFAQTYWHRNIEKCWR